MPNLNKVNDSLRNKYGPFPDTEEELVWKTLTLYRPSIKWRIQRARQKIVHIEV